MKTVYIHGIKNKPEKDILKDQWDRALYGSNQGQKTNMAYWVNRDRYPTPSNALARVHGGLFSASELAPLAVEYQQASSFDEYETLRSKSDSQALRQRVEQAIGGNKENMAILEDILEEIADHHLPELNNRSADEIRDFKDDILKSLGKGVEDVKDFMCRDDARSRMVETLAHAMPQTQEPVILVSHSQGTMIALETLYAYPDRWNVALFITMGSPLGTPEVYANIKSRHGKPFRRLKVPSQVNRWVNITHKADIISFRDKKLNGDFSGNIDDFVGRWWEPTGTKDAHSSIGYLQAKPTQEAVHGID